MRVKFYSADFLPGMHKDIFQRNLNVNIFCKKRLVITGPETILYHCKEYFTEAHTTTGATSRNHKETINLQHTDHTSRRRPSVEKIKKKFLRKLLSKELLYRILVS
jgi:hypothetical protein